MPDTACSGSFPLFDTFEARNTFLYESFSSSPNVHLHPLLRPRPLALLPPSCDLLSWGPSPHPWYTAHSCVDFRRVQKGALSTSEVCEALGLPELRARKWHVQGAIAIRGEGLYEGLDWLSDTLKGMQRSGQATSVKSATR